MAWECAITLCGNNDRGLKSTGLEEFFQCVTGAGTVLAMELGANSIKILEFHVLLFPQALRRTIDSYLESESQQ